jgi:hypothetical protein
LKVGSVRNELINTGQGAGPPSDAGRKTDGMLSRMLGSGLADTVVLVVDGFGVPNTMEKVVVTEAPLEVVVDVSDASEDSEDSDGARSCNLLRSISCSDSMTQPRPSR